MSNLESVDRGIFATYMIFFFLANCFLLDIELGVNIYLFTIFQLKVYIRTRPIIKARS